jgi:hypothetical protein
MSDTNAISRLSQRRKCEPTTHENNPKLSIALIANIHTNGFILHAAQWMMAPITTHQPGFADMSVNMTIFLTLIVPFSIALAGVFHI